MHEKIINTYASVLKDLCISNDGLREELNNFFEIINDIRELNVLIYSKVFTPEEKKQALKVILKEQDSSKIFTSTILFLLENHRLEYINLIITEMNKRYLIHQGIRQGIVEGAQDSIKEKEITFFLKKMKEYYPEKIILKYVKNDMITAGYRVRVDGIQLDFTLDQQLKNLFKKGR